MYEKEELEFTKDFLAALRLTGREYFPIAGDEFEASVERLTKTLKDKNSFPSTLFMQQPITGTYPRFRACLAHYFGTMYSVLAPAYHTAKLEFGPERAEFILQEKNKQTRTDFLTAAIAFLNIEIKNEE